MFQRIVPILFVLLLITGLLPAAAIGGDTTSIPGKIALVGADYNVYTYNFAQEALAPLSQDANRTRHYQWPTWSSDGRIAYFCCDFSAGQASVSQAYIAASSAAASQMVYESSNTAIIYAYWSPANCSEGAGCRDLALLVNNVMRGSLAIEMLRHNADSTSQRTIDVGAPFYYHWNPDGTQMVFHRNNTRIDIYDIAQNDLSVQFEQPSSGLYQAPAWSPVDNRVLFGVRGDSRGTTNLVIAEGNSVRTLLPDVRGILSFLWSPDGRYIAYRAFARDEVGPVVVVDARTGEEISHSELTGIIAFFWSPDSSKVAYLTIPAAENRSAQTQDSSRFEFQWSVLDIELGTNVGYRVFSPTYEMGYLIQYFDQFSPSHRVWSPDSRYLVYSGFVEVDGGVKPQVYVMDIHQPNSEPFVVADGVFGVWSFE